MKTKVLSIREYVHQLDWDNICKIHDSARLIELEGSVSEKAFIPLADCYKEEELFDSSIFIGEQNNETIGFVAFNEHEITWLYFRAISLYKSCGFKVISESKGKIPLTDFEATGLKMEKDDEIV